jgi:hypothetical protein
MEKDLDKLIGFTFSGNFNNVVIIITMSRIRILVDSMYNLSVEKLSTKAVRE